MTRFSFPLPFCLPSSLLYPLFPFVSPTPPPPFDSRSLLSFTPKAQSSSFFWDGVAHTPQAWGHKGSIEAALESHSPSFAQEWQCSDLSMHRREQRPHLEGHV